MVQNLEDIALGGVDEALPFPHIVEDVVAAAPQLQRLLREPEENLEDMGFTVVPFGQGYKDMSPPSKELYKLLMEGI